MAILSQLKDLEMVQMMIKNPPLEQTGGPKEEGQERNPILPVLQVKRQPRQQERLPVQDLRLTRNLLSQSLSIRGTMHSTDSLKTYRPRSSKRGVQDEQAEEEDPRVVLIELTDSTFDFSAFVLNRLNVQTLTPELLARESARDVYSKRRIIAVTKVEIVEWHDYKHLDWITVRRDDVLITSSKKETSTTKGSKTLKIFLLLLVQ
ncbi:hypothetical protein Tco_0020298 [Tanacetum coccineum]